SSLHLAEPRYASRYGDSLVSDQTSLRELPVLVDVHIPRGGGWGGLPIVERGRVSVLEMKNHVAASSQVASFRKCDCQRKSCRDSSVDRVAARLENVDPDFARASTVARDHRVWSELRTLYGLSR